MALVSCEDCKAEISAAATACPKCGRPADRGPAPGSFVLATFRVLVLAAVACLAYRGC